MEGRPLLQLTQVLPVSSERWVLLKGGHLPGDELVDLLFDGDRMVEMRGQRIDTKNTIMAVFY